MNDVSVGYAVKATKQGVGNSHGSADNYRQSIVQSQHNGENGSFNTAKIKHFDSQKIFECISEVLPKAERIAADQNTSPHKAGKNNSPPTRDPYFSWNGSSMVTYPRPPWAMRIGLAKNIPPYVQFKEDTVNNFGLQP